jgi:FixJ family two-component response regulator
MAEAIPTVIVIDDDPAIRESIGGLLRSVGLQPKLFISVDEFLKAGRPAPPAWCSMSGFPDEAVLISNENLPPQTSDLPIIFITGYGDITMSVRAMKGGAIEFLTKPFRDQDLLDAIQLGIARPQLAGERKSSGRVAGALRDPHPARA